MKTDLGEIIDGPAFKRTDWVLRDHAACPVPWPDAKGCSFGQGEHGPIEIFIRKSATDADLDRVSKRFQVPIMALRAFRAHQTT